MNVNIELWGQLRDAAGEGVLMLRFDEPPRLKDVFHRLLSDANDSLSKLLQTEEGEPSRSLLFFINNSQVSLEDDIILSDDAVITLMYPISGG